MVLHGVVIVPAERDADSRRNRGKEREQMRLRDQDVVLQDKVTACSVQLAPTRAPGASAACRRNK